MHNYLEVHYNQSKKPITDYPRKLCNYLVNRYSIAPGSELVDVGCGRRDFLNAFKLFRVNAHGLDAAEFGGAASRNNPVKIVNFESGRFPFEDSSIDVVFSKSVIEHLHNPENFLHESHRILKPGGRIIVMTPDWRSHTYVFYDDHTHVQPYTGEGLCNALNMYGFMDVNVEIFYQLPIVWQHPCLTRLLRPLRILFPVKRAKGNNFWRWSRELMLLGTAVK